MKRAKASFSIVACLVVCLTQSSGAQDIARAQRLLSDQNWQASERVLREYLNVSPSHADASALLGFSLFHQARFEECVDPLETALQGDTSHAPRVLYYLGLARSKLSQPDASVAAFSKLLMAYPESEEAQRIGGGEPGVDDDAKDRRGIDVSGTLVSAEVGLDTNPDLTDSGDADVLMNLYASTDLGLESLPFLIGASFFLEKYADQSENDFMVMAVDANREFELSDVSMIDGALELSQSWSDFDGYEHALSAVGDWDRVWSSAWRTRTRASLGFVSADDDNTSDGVRTRLRVRGYRYPGRSGPVQRVRVQAQVVHDDRDFAPDGYNSFLLGVEGRWAVAKGVSLDLGVDYETRDYDDGGSDVLRSREDDVIDLSAYLMKRLAPDRFLTCQAEISSRDSSVAFYDAGGFMLSVGLLWLH